MSVLSGAGAQDLLRNRRWFVDKTMFIREIVEKNHRYLFLRPRRFGKSVNLEMLSLFLSNLMPNEELFRDYEIFKDQEFFEQHFGKYPVINLSFQDASRCQTWGNMRRKIWKILRKEALRHGVPDFDYNLDSKLPPEDDDLTSFLEDLIEALYNKYNAAVYVLIDEYDAPLNYAFSKGFYEEASEFFGSLYSNAFKKKTHMHRACLMGILEVHGLGILSTVNNLFVCNMTTPQFSRYFGFLPDEVKTSFCTEKLLFEDYMKWYNGYSVGDSKILNPWSVVMASSTQVFKCYWNLTASTDTLFRKFFFQSAKVVARVLRYIDEPEYKHEIREPKPFLNYGCDETFSEHSVWSFFILTGYLNYEPSQDPTRQSYGYAKIPNEEIRRFWDDNIKELISASINPECSSDFAGALLTTNIEEIYDTLEGLVMTASFLDLPRENSYHTLLLGALYISFKGDSNVRISSNIESGHGRPDLAIEFVDKKLKIIFELKKSLALAHLDKHAKDAHKQAVENRYFLPLDSNWQALIIGVSFFKKTVSSFCYSFLRCDQAGKITSGERQIYSDPTLSSVEIEEVNSEPDPAQDDQTLEYTAQLKRNRAS